MQVLHAVDAVDAVQVETECEHGNEELAAADDPRQEELLQVRRLQVEGSAEAA